jgi:hypothetical protein
MGAADRQKGWLRCEETEIEGDGDQTVSAVDGFSRNAAIFLYCKPEAAVNRKIERRQGVRMVSSESLYSALKSSTCLAGKARMFLAGHGPRL